MTKKIELQLIKDNTGITAANEAEGKIDHFDESEQARLKFIEFMLEEFINKEVEDGVKYKK